MPDVIATLDQEQVKLLVELFQRDICLSQTLMRMYPARREEFRKRIILAQAVRRKIPECYWR